MRTKFTLRVGLVLLWAVCALACRNHESEMPLSVASPFSEEAGFLPATDSTKTNDTIDNASVWVCQSASAKKYHFNRGCGGLKNCKHTIEKSSVKEAEAIGLTRCVKNKCNQ